MDGILALLFGLAFLLFVSVLLLIKHSKRERERARPRIWWDVKKHPPEDGPEGDH